MGLDELYSVAARFRSPARPLARVALSVLAVTSGLFGATAVAAQVPVRAPGGIIGGQVLEDNGAPIPYALVILDGTNVRMFANQVGRFAFRAPSAGERTLSVQQIGYAQVQIRLQIELLPAGEQGSPPLTVRLSRRVFVLPDLVVEASSCERTAEKTDSESEATLGLAFQNAERLLTLERAYPSRSVFLKEVRVLDADRNDGGSWTDTLYSNSRDRQGYRPGKVIQGESAVYFSAADIAERDFRRHHCFWYGGRDRDSASGIPVIRINFVPTARTKSPDWAGSLVLDSASSVLLRSEALLVNIPKRSSFTSARCIVDYMEIVPTLVHESRAVCGIRTRKLQQGFVLVERWTLRRHEFLGPRPDSIAGVAPP